MIYWEQSLDELSYLECGGISAICASKRKCYNQPPYAAPNNQWVVPYCCTVYYSVCTINKVDACFIPAFVTCHFTSFLHSNELCLLLLHWERGIILPFKPQKNEGFIIQNNCLALSKGEGLRQELPAATYLRELDLTASETKSLPKWHTAGELLFIKPGALTRLPNNSSPMKPATKDLQCCLTLTSQMLSGGLSCCVCFYSAIPPLLA